MVFNGQNQVCMKTYRVIHLAFEKFNNTTVSIIRIFMMDIEPRGNKQQLLRELEGQ